MFGRGRRNFEAALRDLKAERSSIRASAAEDLAVHGPTHRADVVEALIEALNDEAPDVRAAAAVGLADVGAEEAVEPLVAAAGDRDEHVRQMALAALGELRATEAADCVADALDHACSAVRFQAVIAYPRVTPSTDEAVRVLLEATADDDPLVRHIALRMAEEVGDQDAGPAVPGAMLARARELLEDDSDVVRVAAAVILGRSGLRDGTDILIDVAQGRVLTSEADDEAAAIDLCGELGLEEATPGLVERGYSGGMLSSRDTFAWQARVALAALGYTRARRWVLGELKAWTRERRSLGVAAVIQAKLPEARPLLEAMKGDPSRADPELVAEALAALDESTRP